MRLGTSRPSVLYALLASCTVVVYAAGVAVLPAAHAAVEQLWSDRSVEAEHSDSCPTLHAGAVCTALAGLGHGQPGGSPQKIHIAGTPAADDQPLADEWFAAPPSKRPDARAPPLS